MNQIIEVLVMLSLAFSMGTTQQQSMIKGIKNVVDSGWIRVVSQGEIEGKDGHGLDNGFSEEEERVLEDNARWVTPYDYNIVDDMNIKYTLEGYINLNEKQADLTIGLINEGKEENHHIWIKDGWLYVDTALVEAIYEKDSSITANTEFYKEGYSRNIFQDIKQEYITIPVHQWKDVMAYTGGWHYDEAMLKQLVEIVSRQVPIEQQGNQYTLHMNDSNFTGIFMEVIDFFKRNNKYYGYEGGSSEERKVLNGAITKVCQDTSLIATIAIDKDKVVLNNEFNLCSAYCDRLKGKVSASLETVKTYTFDLPQDVKRIKNIRSYYYGARIVYVIDDSETVKDINKLNKEGYIYTSSSTTYIDDGHRYIDPLEINKAYNIVIEYDKKNKQCYWTSLDNIDLSDYINWNKTFKKTTTGLAYPSYIIDIKKCEYLKTITLIDGQTHLVSVGDLMKAGLAEEYDINDGKYIVVTFPLV